jgi:cell division protein FtsI/penicillin-binding protein 2
VKLSRPRLRLLATIFGLALACVLAHLYLLMVEQNEAWLERSYRNRWAFKDVPARRGSLLDRSGVPLVEDHACFSLHLHYRTFRRHHPLGLAVHGANLMMQAQGIGDDVYRYDGDRNGPRQACRQLLDLPVAWTRPDPPSVASARDLRFYASGLLAAMLDRPRGAVLRAIDEAIAAGSGQTVARALGDDARERASAAFDRRFAELEEFAAALRAASPSAPPLIAALERARQAGWDDSEAEHRLDTLQRALPFEVVVQLARRHERHPGLQLRPAVERRTTAALRAAPSLEPLLGAVTPYWREDEAEIRRQVRAMMAAPEQRMQPAEDLPDEILEAIEVEATQAARLYFVNHGRVGRGGVESVLDERLSGRPGLRWVERDKGARERALWSHLDVAPGENATLSIDLRLQQHLEDALSAALGDDREQLAGAREIAVAVLDPASGDVLALGGRPLSSAGEPRFISPAVGWSHGPGFVGSVAKPYLLIEYLEALGRDSTLRSFRDFNPCVQRYRRIAGTERWLTCSGTHGDDARDCAAALAESCNFFYFQAAEAIGRGGVERAYRRAGWLEAGEPPARVFGLAWEPRLRPLGAGLVQSVAIGYGVEVNALLVARAYAGLATGVLPAVSLVRGERPEQAVALGVDERIRAVVLDGMRQCVTSGTADGVPALVQLGVLGKTGTAEINTQRRNNAWFAGFVSRAQPTLAFAAVAYDVPDAEHGGEGVARLVARFLQSVAADARLQPLYLPEVEAR